MCPSGIVHGSSIDVGDAWLQVGTVDVVDVVAGVMADRTIIS
jgi:hypothetical protein